jgi:hypothetical protein
MRGRPPQNQAPVVVVWKASKHGRSKPKMKVFKTKHVDEILTKKMHGIPEDAIILDVGVGSGFVERYKKKHKLK